MFVNRNLLRRYFHKSINRRQRGKLSNKYLTRLFSPSIYRGNIHVERLQKISEIEKPPPPGHRLLTKVLR